MLEVGATDIEEEEEEEEEDSVFRLPAVRHGG
jgi:hypothetical protein